jgi:hypothetical protein
MPVSINRWVNRIEVYWLTALVAVVDQLPVAHIPRPDGVVERRDDQVGGRASTAVPADHLVGEHISHAGQPQHALDGEDAGEICDPLLVGPAGRAGDERGLTGER